ncbi:uncharacterized protein [Cicer arietinum]|uniref:Uncharacterized protein LOC105852172 n=1 Tax=Cicer arietinum TaxID=3827 RepID=A0A1S3E7G9_CICAR|nr:uncharacterized protein LOC105852172 [Cicer arietinum]
MGKMKRNPLSDLTNSNPLPSSSISSSSLQCVNSIPSSHIFHNNQTKALPTPPKTSNIRLNLTDAKPLTVRCRKKQRVMSSEQDDLFDFIEKQKAYFKEIDEFELAEEEVESINELE